jgi:hypothetical protein
MQRESEENEVPARRLGGQDELGSLGPLLQKVRELEALYHSMEEQNLYLDIPQDQKEGGQDIDIPIGGPEEEFKIDRTLLEALADEGEPGKQEEPRRPRARMQIIGQPPETGKFTVNEDLELLDYVRSCGDGNPNTRVYWNKAAQKNWGFSTERSSRARWRRYATFLSRLTKSEVSRIRMWIVLHGPQGYIDLPEGEEVEIPEVERSSPEI